MGMWMSFTKKPMKPMMRKPTEVASAILENSDGGGEGTKQDGGTRGEGVPPTRRASQALHPHTR